MDEIYLNIGARIRFRDGMGGTLHKVVIDPHTRRITDLVVVQGLLQKHDHVIPVSVVEQASADEIVVSLNLQDLVNCQEYREVELQERLDDWEHDLLYQNQHVVTWQPLIGITDEVKQVIPVIRHRVPVGIPFGEKVIGRPALVRNVDGVVGKIDHLWLDRESWEITHLIVRRGVIPHYVVIPFSWISSITPNQVFIQGRDSHLKEVPISRLHMELMVASEAGGNEQRLDETLAIVDEIYDALAEDPRTSSSVIEVVYDQGVVTLSGEVESTHAHLAAEQIAHRHPRVVAVVNALEIHPKESVIVEIAGRMKPVAYTHLMHSR